MGLGDDPCEVDGVLVPGSHPPCRYLYLQHLNVFVRKHRDMERSSLDRHDDWLIRFSCHEPRRQCRAYQRTATAHELTASKKPRAHAFHFFLPAHVQSKPSACLTPSLYDEL